jgi:hypothetical protein
MMVWDMFKTIIFVFLHWPSLLKPLHFGGQFFIHILADGIWKQTHDESLGRATFTYSVFNELGQ